MKTLYYTLLVIFSIIASIMIGVVVAQIAIAEAPQQGYWKIKDNSPMYAEYKNDILVRWQDELIERGIVNTQDLKLFTAQALTENGALSPTVIGDNGCSLGIPQRNFCVYNIKAKTALKRWEEWNDIDFQLKWFANATQSNLEIHKEVKWAIIAHNAPKLAHNKIEAKYWKAVNLRTADLEYIL